jgi:hypothetical protein
MSLGEGLVVGMQNMGNAIRETARTALVRPVTTETERSFSAPEFQRSSVINETINSFSDGGTGTRGGARQTGTTPTFVFSPTYNFQGEAPSKKDLVDAAKISQREFEKMMDNYLRKKGRVAFA